MAYQKTNKPVGRPRKNLEPEQLLGVRVSERLHERLTAEAAVQKVPLKSLVETILWERLDQIQRTDTAIDIATDTLEKVHRACKACPQCSAAIDHIMTEAWSALIGPEKETA
jgi:HicB family